MAPDELALQISAGSVRAVARACRLVDDREAGASELLRRLHPRAQAAWLVGITGSPGAGKSTLVDRLIERLRADGKRVGVVAVDPSSPFSGGAILGDRVRMQRHFEDPEVFIRSLATRGALGGLSQSAADVATVLGAWGADVVLVETVGVGQDELEVTEVVDTTVVVVAPGLGDDVQALKAGILECADVFVVNKADHAGADSAVRELEAMLALGDAVSSARGHVEEQSDAPWRPPIVRAVATTSVGVDDVLRALSAHRSALSRRGTVDRTRKMAALLRSLVARALSERALGALASDIDQAAARVAGSESDPYSESERLVARFLELNQRA